MSVVAHTRVYLARHCDVHNPDGVLYGHLPNFPLSEKGVVQAHSMGRYLATTGVRRIWASPLERAQQTARIIAEHIEGAQVSTTDDLIEARFGLHLQGVKPGHIPWRRPLWFVHMARPGLLPNDEKVSELAARVQRPITRILADLPGEGGICVSHGDPIQGFWVRASGRRDWALHRLQCAKGGMLELDYEGRRLATIVYRPPDPVRAGDRGEPDDPGGNV